MNREEFHKLSLQKQLERRRQRGIEELARIVNRGEHPVYSAFEVTSASKQSYTVQIHSITQHFNTCTCPDYLSNTIGTCKHIEGVLANLHKKYARRWNEFLSHVPSVNRMYLHHADRTTVRLSLPFPKIKRLKALLTRYFDAEGVLQSRVTHSLPALLQELDRAAAKKRVIIDQAVHDHLKLQREIDAAQQQKQWFLDQVKRGNRSLSVLATPLYGYQEEGVMHLSFGRRTLLADDMGLGKTIQAIAAASLLKQLRDIRRVLIVTPASLKHQWAREIKRFTSLSAQVIEGNRLQRRRLFEKPEFFNIANYEVVRYDEEEIARQKFDLVILDEAQRIKNWRAKTAVSVKRLKSPYAFVLTGTPLENRLDELYSVFQFIDPTILGPLWRFNQRYYDVQRRPSGTFKVLGYKGLDELRHRIAPYILRRLRAQVQLDLPERIDSNFFVEMTAPQWDAYREYEHKVARLMSIAHRRPLTPEEHKILLGCMVKMRVICNALALHDSKIGHHDCEKTAPKLRELREILEEEIVGNGRKTIIFSQWTGMLSLTEPILKRLKLGWVKLTGDVPSGKRGKLIERFFEDPDCKVFLSTDAGGVGLNLQAASMVINLDLPWNPAVLEQRIARAHRHRQSDTVNVVNLIAKGTIEERMLDTLNAKRAVFDAALQEDSTVTDLTFKDVGQGVLQRLEVLLGATEPAAAELSLEPAVPSMPEPETVPSMHDFANILVARYPGRILLVRDAPQLPGGRTDKSVLVVVDRDPILLRPLIEQLLKEHQGTFSAPALLLMEREGFRAFSALTAGVMEEDAPESSYYRSPAIPLAARDDVQKTLEVRLRRANERLDAADKRLTLASVVLQNGFPGEMLRPIRQAMGLALTAQLSLFKDDKAPAEELPPPHLLETELVATGRMPAELAARLERIRVLTVPQAGDKDVFPPAGIKNPETFIATIKELIDNGRELAAKQGL